MQVFLERDNLAHLRKYFAPGLVLRENCQTNLACWMNGGQICSIKAIRLVQLALTRTKNPLEKQFRKQSCQYYCAMGEETVIEWLELNVFCSQNSKKKKSQGCFWNSMAFMRRRIGEAISHPAKLEKFLWPGSKCRFLQKFTLGTNGLLCGID